MMISALFPYSVNAGYPLLAVGQPLLNRLMFTTVSKRVAMRAAANDARYHMVNATFNAVGRVAANDAKFVVSAKSTLRHASDISWVSMAIKQGIISLSDLNVNENENVGIAFIPEAIKLENGKYAINVNGETKLVDGVPSWESPIIYRYTKRKQDNVIDDEVIKSYELDSKYRYYYESKVTSYFYQSNNIGSLSQYVSINDYYGNDVEEYEEIQIEDKKYSYLSNRKTVETILVRYEDLGDFYKPIIKQIITENRIKSSFEPIKMSHGVNKPIYSFNEPVASDYETSTGENIIDYIYFKQNKNWVGDFEPKETEQELGSIADIEPNWYNKPLTARQLAALFNALMMSASAQADYDGLPFNSSNPFTEAEINQVINELGIQPNYSHLLAKAGQGNKLVFDIKVNNATRPESNAKENHNNQKDNSEDIDDSEMVYPELEAPTVTQILEPFKLFFPNLQNLVIQEKNATCPTWSFKALNHEYTIDGHCQLIESHRGLFSSIFLLIWSIISLRKLLSA